MSCPNFVILTHAQSGLDFRFGAILHLSVKSNQRMHSFYRTLPSDYLGKLSNQLLFITWVGGGEGGSHGFQGERGIRGRQRSIKGARQTIIQSVRGSQVNFIVIKPKFSGPPSFSSSIKNDRSNTQRHLTNESHPRKGKTDSNLSPAFSCSSRILLLFILSSHLLLVTFFLSFDRPL